MTERRGDQGFSVTPQRIGGDAAGRSTGRRTRRFGLAVVVIVAAAIIGVGWLGPRLDGRPNFDVSYFATPTPGLTPSPSPSPYGPEETPLFPGQATPLPAVTRADVAGPRGGVAIVTSGVAVLDLATGVIAPGPSVVPGRDALFRTLGGGGWSCVCFDDLPQERAIHLWTIDRAGVLGDDTVLGSIPRPASDVDQSHINTDVDLGEDHRTGVVAIAIRDGRSWRVSIGRIAFGARALGPLAEVGLAGNTVAPSATPTPTPEPGTNQDVYFDGPHVRLSPDGRVAFVWGMLEPINGDPAPARDFHAWRVPIAPDGSFGHATPAPGLLEMPAFCSSVGFAAADRLMWLCPRIPTDQAVPFDGVWDAGAVDLEGQPAGRNDVATVADNSYLEAIFDRANGQMYGWDAFGLTVLRVDAHTLVASSTTFDPLVRGAPGMEPGGGDRPPAWQSGASASGDYGGRLAGTSDGKRLVALGYGPAQQESGLNPSRGIFVIDRRTLALVDRWDPAANYSSIGVLGDGSVAVSGMPQVEANGQFAPWDASLTIHDETDGRIVVRFGQLGQDPIAAVLGG
jgi:hypothetical protein